MPLLVILLFFLAELYVFVWFAGLYGFFPTLAGYWLPCLIGGLILRNYWRLWLRRPPQIGDWPSLRWPLVGVLLLTPFFFTRVLALVALLPGLGFLGRLFVFRWLSERLATFQFQQNHFGFVFRTYGVSNFPGQSDSQEREAEVIEVKPVQIEHRPKRP
ncbi:MAG: FxsA family protein [Bdellovibrionaceae bacterium]|nr:FxsA family protein [Pseudobdellovibrionaceae bacterium]